MTGRVARRVKECHPELRTLLGGPSVDDSDEQLLELLNAYAGIDFAIPSEGEYGTTSLVSVLGDGDAPEGIIPGVAYLGPNGVLVRGDYQRPRLEDIPSPYLGGTLDRFLDEGMVPGA